MGGALGDWGGVQFRWGAPVAGEALEGSGGPWGPWSPPPPGSPPEIDRGGGQGGGGEGTGVPREAGNADRRVVLM